MNIITTIRQAFSPHKREAGIDVQVGSRLYYAPREGTSEVQVSGESTALKVSTVFRCVKLLSESVANLRCQYMTQTDGVFTEFVGSPLHYLLTIQPMESMNAFDFWVHTVQEMLLQGNAYIYPRTVMGEITDLVLLGRGTCAYDSNSDTYTVTDTVNKVSGTFDESEIIHLKGMSLDGKNGVSVLHFAAVTLSIAATGDSETQSRFANGGNVRGYNREKILARSNAGKGSLTYEVDAKGVKFTFDAPHTALGDEAVELVKRGDLAGCSFCYSTDEDDSVNCVSYSVPHDDGGDGTLQASHRLRLCQDRWRIGRHGHVVALCGGEFVPKRWSSL